MTDAKSEAYEKRAPNQMSTEAQIKSTPSTPTPCNSITSPAEYSLECLMDIASLIETGSCKKEVRHIARAVRLTNSLKKKLAEPNLLSAFLDFALSPRSELHNRLSGLLYHQGYDLEMEVDSATSAPAKRISRELEIYCYFLMLLFLIDQNRYSEAKAFSSAAVARVKNLSRGACPTAGVLASRVYFYYSYVHEILDELAEIRWNLLHLLTFSTLHHDDLGQFLICDTMTMKQETLLNLLLRNYLHYNFYDQAEKLRSKALRFQSHTIQQVCRYLFYLGKIQTIQLKYNDARESLLHAARKAPVAAHGFRVLCKKWAVLVHLLLGEIPERTIFTQSVMEWDLRPYFMLTNAVRTGDLELFRNVAEDFFPFFSSDKTYNLIMRLRHNVIRTGLRRISMSYSRISLADVAEKLKLDSANPVEDVESIAAKAIRDGAIHAILDHANGWLVSKDTGDIYSTAKPLAVFSSRIASCLNLHNEAVKALRFPPKTPEDKDSDEYWIESQVLCEELAREYMDEDEDEDETFQQHLCLKIQRQTTTPPLHLTRQLSFSLMKNSELNARLSSFLIIEEDEEADSAMCVCTKEFSLELEFYFCSLNGIARAMSLNMAELDFVSVLPARLYFYYSYSYEVSGDLAEICRNLLEWYSVAALNHDELGQETLLNLLLRNYLHYNLYEQAEKLRSKAPKILTRSNKQTLRYLFYTGKIQTIRLAYTDAKESFQQAVLRAPVAARGFRIQCSKWAVLAHLLLGEIPEKTIFMQTGMKRALRPYFELTNGLIIHEHALFYRFLCIIKTVWLICQALRIGDLELFCNVTEMFSGTFISDRTKNVIVPLQHNVIRTGLCNISISYSRISLAEVADRLKLHSRNLLPDVENIVAKAIHDGAINAKIDHANGWLISKETRDIYATAEPQAAFSSRIAFYLNLYNETVRASHFPSDNDTHEKRRSASQVLYGEVLELLEEVRDKYFK
uniref:PCI domain-containing protein n=1 Tax=Salix viminalis TaxID=40686 RepID=A0A6N2K3R8_SALVM